MKQPKQENEVFVTSFTPLLKFASSIQIQIPFSPFSCLTILAKTFTTMGNGNGESEHLFLVPHHRKKVLSLPVSMIWLLAVGFS